mmetsp:Transcript_33218/g.36769  ORF Transcript_33218/g.36769 Transcript_33218/m.36769 type:complete len:113 (-) Transcript_33218:199-537(-)|eukprot:CAMPEP_0194144188 /NCGR_PEP_ID=MMETSP0152-20130528/13257_1 /TAXON_ID=1049557 /ORGANISM="Thalassiothrix antarctica, Strain L6-D1" /LENGTH=112 /DNA_ID=CAMNT_0038843919 /DNA_START=37 /DNA_END=375 /DNA_ORIENTATION=-
MTNSSDSFLGGALSFKGDKKKKKKKAKKKTQETIKHEKKKKEEFSLLKEAIDDGELTPFERKAFKLKDKQALRDIEEVARKSHRERVEEYNEKLGMLTELNDIPRVSAAGNG